MSCDTGHCFPTNFPSNSMRETAASLRCVHLVPRWKERTVPHYSPSERERIGNLAADSLLSPVYTDQSLSHGHWLPCTSTYKIIRPVHFILCKDKFLLNTNKWQIVCCFSLGPPKSVFLFFLVSISVWHLFSSENLTDTNGEKRTPVVLQMPSQCPQSEESGFAKRQEGCQGQRQTPHPLWGKGDGENKEIRRGPCINIIWTFKTAKKWRLLNNE